MVQVAVMGHGVVGSGVVEVLTSHAESIAKRAKEEINIKYILDIREFPDSPLADRFTKNFEDILNDEEVKVVAEVMGGVNPAYDFVKRCLQAGKSVVTSNKELVAKKGAELLAIAQEKNANFLFEASVGGGIPIIRPMSQCLAANDVIEIAGILNGTTNFILTKMIREQMPFADALKMAQELGYAERNPKADIEGDAFRVDTVRHISRLTFNKVFNLSKNKQTSLKEYVIDMVKGNLFFDEFWALENVSFELKRGESMGLVGVNGSGKSTLLRLIAGIMEPTYGTIYTKGTIAPLIALGGGFEPTLSARENVYLNGAMHGHSTEFMRKRFDDIISFAELEEFVDVPIKNFSSGMLARLGFSIATSVHADIVIADEVLSVGDARFRKKCEARIANLLKEGTTVLYVSHNVNSVVKMCKKALWLEKGRVIQNGNARDVCIAYKRYIEEQTRLAKEAQEIKNEKA